jgi:excisionase family DNA binding protein
MQVDHKASQLEELLSANEVAEALKVHPRSISRWAIMGLLPSVTFGVNVRRFRREDVEAFVLNGKAS